MRPAGEQYRRPAGADRLALSLLRGQPRPGLRPPPAYGMRLDLPAGTAVRFEPGEIKTVQLVALGGQRVRSTAATAWSWARSTIRRSKQRSLERMRQTARFQVDPSNLEDACHERQAFARRLRRALRPHHRRPHPPCRHRAAHRDRKRLHRLRRGSPVRRRQGHPRQPGPIAAARPLGRTASSIWSSPTPSSSTTGASSRATSASATAGSSPSARRAIR